MLLEMDYEPVPLNLPASIPHLIPLYPFAMYCCSLFHDYLILIPHASLVCLVKIPLTAMKFETPAVSLLQPVCVT